MTTLDEALAALPVIAVIRAAGSRHLNAVLETLAGTGVRAMEITMTTPGAAEAIRWAAGGGLRGVAVGAGTVLDAVSARRAVDAGAGYLITPAVLPEVIEEGRQLGVPVLPGAATCRPGPGPWAWARRCWATRAPTATRRRWPPEPDGWSRSPDEGARVGEPVTLGEVVCSPFSVRRVRRAPSWPGRRPRWSAR